MLPTPANLNIFILHWIIINREIKVLHNTPKRNSSYKKSTPTLSFESAPRGLYGVAASKSQKLFSCHLILRRWKIKIMNSTNYNNQYYTLCRFNFVCVYCISKDTKNVYNPSKEFLATKIPCWCEIYWGLV